MIDVMPSAPSRPITLASARDRAANALVLGFAGAMWFAWAQEGPPAGWATPLTVGGILGVALATFSGLLTWLRRHGTSAMGQPDARGRYARVVQVEVASIVVGSVLLGVTGAAAYIAAWILLVVGVHFIPLGRLFHIRSLEIVGVLLVPVSAVAAAAGLSGAVLPSAVAGGGGGALMVAFGAWSLRRSWHSPVEV